MVAKLRIKTEIGDNFGGEKPIFLEIILRCNLFPLPLQETNQKQKGKDGGTEKSWQRHRESDAFFDTGRCHSLLDVSRLRFWPGPRSDAERNGLDVDAAVVAFWCCGTGISRMAMELDVGTSWREASQWREPLCYILFLCH